MRLVTMLLLLACGGPPELPAPSCPAAYPNAAPNALCCDASWEWCLTGDGGTVGGP